MGKLQKLNKKKQEGKTEKKFLQWEEVECCGDKNLGCHAISLPLGSVDTLH